ncbi:cytochrome P450 [Micromonospora eburnea]|uniref:Cytochrome P450 n=1 Tax=Micromonospora eburnea TaxID=227316 RepID=A0A1C6UTS1_9ACTN|nr:cytochrome P450 [Micromonospora eburnea]SCL57425.1 Cytochrome P450 [Micromonospora eburnea]
MSTSDRRPGTPPGPPRHAALRMLAVMARDRLGMITDAVDRYGDAVRLPVGHKSLHVFNHPEHAKHVLADNAANYRKGIGLVHARRALGDGLLTSEGELWRKQRKVIQPAFQPRRLAHHAGLIAAEAERLTQRLRQRRDDGPIDVVAEFTGLTLGVLGRTLLDADLSAFGSIGEEFAAVQDQAMFELATLGAVPTWLPLRRQLRFRRARRELQRVVDQLVAERAGRAAGQDDVLSRLIVSTRGESDPRVARDRLRDELVTLLLAGHETTASTLGWTLYLIDREPEVRQRLRQEADQVLGGRLPTYEDLHHLRYTTMVVEEAMRLYPPVWLLPRIARGADLVGGYHVPAGADVVILPYTLHRHREFWVRPERFDPDRFDPARARDRPRYAYIPFGAGPRVCVGSNLGLMEAVFVLAMIAREFRLSIPRGHRVMPEPMLSLRIRGGLPMLVRTVDAAAG